MVSLDTPPDPVQLTTKESIRKLAKIRNINIDVYTDSDLEDFIEEITEYIENETGRALLVQSKTDTRLGFTGHIYITDFSPIVSVESVKIEGDIIDPENYQVDMKRGIFRLEDYFRMGGYSLGHQFSVLSNHYPDIDIEIQYTAGLIDIPKRIHKIATDCVLMAITYDPNDPPGQVTQIVEGKKQTYFDTNSLDDSSIDQRLNRLKRPSIRLM